MIRALLAFLFSLSAFAGGPRYISDDVVVLDDARPLRPVKLSSVVDEDCKAAIKKSVCLVSDSDRKCAPDSKNYVPLFEKIHDRIPEFLQKMFCRVEKIYVEKDLKSTAYASPWSSAIGIRQSLLDKRLTFAQWATWKEQLTFGGELYSYETDEKLPTFVSNGSHEEFVMNVVIHEFGHLFDFATDLNAMESGALKKGTFGALAWKLLTKPLENFDYPDRAQVCFYDCGDEPLPASAVTRVYQDVYKKTNFLNTYTSRNAREDFADTFAFIYSFQISPEMYYKLETRQGATFDFREELKSDRMAEKVGYIQRVVDKDELLYP